MLWHLALEPFEHRYTADWYRWFKMEYEKNNVDYEYVDGVSLTDKIETGRFLDTYNTIHWKTTQMAEVAKLFRAGRVKSGDIFFTCDLWHPGVESIAYMSQLSGIEVKIYGILHAGSYDPYDFVSQAGLGKWAEDFEHGWIKLCEQVFVGTSFHASLINAGLGWQDKLLVTGLPFYADELIATYGGKSKVPRICFPHRLDPEKQPGQFAELQRLMSDLAPDDFIRTAEYAVGNKSGYYRLLAGSTVAVSFSLQETFGYAMLEAAALGCDIVVPDRLSYHEMYPSRCLYQGKGYDDAVNALPLVRRALNNPVKLSDDIWSPYKTSILRMLKGMELV